MSKPQFGNLHFQSIYFRVDFPFLLPNAVLSLIAVGNRFGEHRVLCVEFQQFVTQSVNLSNYFFLVHSQNNVSNSEAVFSPLVSNLSELLSDG